MHIPFRLSKVCFIVIGLVMVLFAVGCGCPLIPWGEPYDAVTFENQTPFPIKVDIRSVSLDYSGTPSLTWDAPVVVIEAGRSQDLVAPLQQDDREIGSMYKYAVAAVTETNEVVFSRVFTWDELDDMDWIIVIPPPPAPS